MAKLPTTLAEWQALKVHTKEIDKTHLRDLLQDNKRNSALCASYKDITLDFARQRLTLNTMNLLFDLAEARDVQGCIKKMFNGEKINTAEDRAVLHVALRAAPDTVIKVDGENVVPEVHKVLGQIKMFTDKIRSGELVGATGKPLTNVVSVGIGGSYLGAEFVYEALKTDPEGAKNAAGRQLRFLANVDPVAVERTTRDLDPETTLVVIISKTFTTAETMLNARTLRKWIVDKLGEDAVSKHMVACSANIEGVTKFGIDKNNIFGFWNWVGGRYSVSSAVGMVPLSLQYGFGLMEKFLAGCRDIDDHFNSALPRENLPLLLGLLGVWNATFLGYGVRAILPYTEALLRFPAHLQQVDMESNGKRVLIDGTALDFKAGAITFGEPGTNGQHSFYQLIHQGRVIPCDFIGFIESQNPIEMKGEVVSNHDELMSNFFAQPDALAVGKSASVLREEKVREDRIGHKTFPGNRPSTSILMQRLDAFSCGQLLAIYEHRTAVEGWVWGINSFDQWGVELGKKLGKQVRNQLNKSRTEGAEVEGFNSSTTAMMRRYLEKSKK